MLDFECPDTAKDTAYHEAGHLVAGHALGWAPDRVALRVKETPSRPPDHLSEPILTIKEK